MSDPQAGPDVEQIVAGLPMSALADQLGVDAGTAESAVRQALPALLGGMQANAQDPNGAASLASALQQHDPGLVEGGVNLGDVDTADGEKIVGHVFGESGDQVAQTLGGNLGGAGGSSDLVKKLLPILAPIVLSYLAQRMHGGDADGQGQGGVGDLLGSILGGMGGAGGLGGPGGGAGSPGGSVLDMLGGLLGGGRR